MGNETIVVNIRHSQYDVLVDRTTIFGNLFPEWKWGREECIRKFESYFWNRVERDPVWKTEVLAIREKGKDGVVRLGCHCKQPDREVACHGDIYAAYLTTVDTVDVLRRSWSE